MKPTMTITVEITTEDGKIVSRTRTDEIPGMEDFERNGFRDSFDKIETAVLESRKEVGDTAIEAYLNDVSKKSL